MGYPKDNPRSKHDICCSPSLLSSIKKQSISSPIESIDNLTSTLLKSSLQKEPPEVKRVATIYTYKDAPTKPKPLSGMLRIENICTYSLFERITSASDRRLDERGGGPLNKCTIAVKLPQVIEQYAHDKRKYTADMDNTSNFRSFIDNLCTNSQVAVLSYDSVGRIGFLVPFSLLSNKGSSEEKYAACLYYAHMKEFIHYAKQNHANQAEQGIPEAGTWTPQYPPPPEEECGPSSERDVVGSSRGDMPEAGTWTPQYTPPHESECGPRGWDTNGDKAGNGLFVPPSSEENGLFVPPSSENDGLFVPPSSTDNGLFVPPGSQNDGLFVPPGSSDDNLFVPPGGDAGYGGFGESAWGNTNGGWDNGGWDNNDTATTDETTGIGGWSAVDKNESSTMTDGVFHANEGAAAADAFYSGLTRSLETRADSRLYHMRAFNGWVKATQIAELDPDTSKHSSSSSKKRSRRSPLRVLDLACGKGGDLGKWTIHQRKVENYVGVDVARGSLIDAAIRARQMVKRGTLKRCTFSLADLGEDVPGRKRSRNAKRMQKLLTWNLESETMEEREHDPKFVMREGGGISETDKFDVVSIQFAIHYMMSTRKRARRFFHTVSSLLEIGGNLIATTIDARVVVEKLMSLGKDFHFDDADMHEEVDLEENEMRHHNGNKKRKVDSEGATVYAGQGVCRLKFDKDILQKVFHPPKTSEDMFGLQYTFTLVEGSDHAAGVGEAVDLPEWLTPILALKELGEEAGLELEYATNFHKFYEERKDPTKFTAAHNALYNMKVLNRNGSISEQEWDVSRMYVAVKFRKVRESEIEIGDEDVGADEMNG